MDWNTIRRKISDPISKFILALVGLCLAFFAGRYAYLTYDLSLADKCEKKLEQTKTTLDSLATELDKYESNRFCMQPPLSSRILKQGLFLYYNGYRHKYTISSFTDTLIHEKTVPLEKPDTFSYNDTTYMIFTEAITDIQGIVGDTACFYFDIFNK